MVASRRGGDIHLYIDPETKPINPSPWYAFRVEVAKDKKITVVLNYTYGKHRYWPKISLDGRIWTTVKAANIKINKDKNRARIKLRVKKGQSLWVAAQEIFTNQQYNGWMVGLAKKNDFLDLYKLGQSVEGRAIYKIESRAATKKKDTIVLIGRQHPPEVTGALAMVSFVETILSDSALAREFREKFRVIIVPNLNPDGVAGGHWRTNANGKDLNRDWGPFSQPETKLMQIELERFRDEKEGHLSLMLDFHSTRKNLIYTQTAQQKTDPENFAANWYSAIKGRLPDIAFKHAPRGKSTKPTSKGYVYKNFGAPAITYEMGDESNRKQIRTLAIVAANEMMTLLLKSTLAP